MAIEQYRFTLEIPAERYLAYYRGTARQVVVRCASGQTVQFPASLLQCHVTHTGVHGEFVLSCDENRRCVGLERVSRSRS